MTIYKESTKKIVLNEEERRAFETVDRILKEFQLNGTKANIVRLESSITGEYVQTKELARVRGVIGFFSEENQIYTEHFKTLADAVASW